MEVHFNFLVKAVARNSKIPKFSSSFKNCSGADLQLAKIDFIGVFPSPEKLDFITEVRDVFVAFHQDEGRRLNTEARHFSTAAEAITRSDLANAQLPRDLWPLAGFEDAIPDLTTFSDARLAQLAVKMREVAEARMEDAEVLGQTKGGPTRNDSIYAVVANLASIYSREREREITHSISPIDGSATSEFDAFVMAAYRDFSPPDWLFRERAIKNAISEALKVENLEFADDWEKVKGSVKPDE